jgi:hypothetical protein
MKNIGVDQAYVAMYEYILEFYNRTKSDEVGALLGGMSYLGDGNTADPSAWNDWLRCVQKALDGSVDASLRLR